MQISKGIMADTKLKNCDTDFKTYNMYFLTVNQETGSPADVQIERRTQTDGKWG